MFISKKYIFMILSLMTHFVVTRCYLITHSDLGVDSAILAQKVLTGTLYDLHVTLLLVLLFYLSDKFLKVRGVLQSLSFYFVFILVAILDLVNLMIYRYFLAGLANYGVLIEYLKDLDTIAAMGAKTFNPLPFILLFSPVLIFTFRHKVKTFTFKERRPAIVLMTLFIINLVLNQLVQFTRINKEEVLETNTLVRLLRCQQQDIQIFNNIREIASHGLSGDDLKLLRQYSDGSFLSDDYPLIKNDNLRPLEYELNKPNIIFIGLESVNAFSTGIKRFMSESDQKRFKAQKSFTPFMDSLLDKSFIVPEFYAHGNFTALAQISALCSIYDPISAVDGQGSIMRNYPELKMKCLPEYLKEVGYKNLFFNGYRKGFDNKSLFLPKAGFDELIFRERIKKDFKREGWEHTWGMTDSTVLEHMVSTLDQTQEPFFSFFMSVNTHAPYDHLNNEPQGTTKHEASLIKTDKAISSFFKAAKTKSWFNNTIFVFFADNGTSFSQLSSKDGMRVKEDYNRIPFFIYSKKLENLFSGASRSSSGAQIDIAPTVMHLVGLNKTKNHFLGKSLFEKDSKRPIFQYKYHNKFYTLPESDNVQKLKQLHMYLILNNLIWKE